MGLISKEYDGSVVPIAMLFVDRNPQHYASDDDYELAYTVAASLFVAGAQQKSDVGLVLETTLPPAHGELHIERGLTELAAAGDVPQTLVEQLFSVRARLPWRATLILIAGQFSPEVATALDALRRSGHAIAVVLVGRDARDAHALGTASTVCSAVALVHTEEELRGLHFVNVRR
jgi:hypothetical protein